MRMLFCSCLVMSKIVANAMYSFEQKKKIIYCLKNFVTLHNIQHTSGNWLLKGQALGSADIYTALLQLAWLIKLVFHLQFFCTKQIFAQFSLVSNFFQSKKVGSNPPFCS